MNDHPALPSTPPPPPPPPRPPPPPPSPPLPKPTLSLPLSHFIHLSLSFFLLEIFPPSSPFLSEFFRFSSLPTFPASFPPPPPPNTHTHTPTQGGSQQVI